MKTKPQKIWTATLLIGLLCMGLAACSTVPQASTPRYQLSADAAWSKLNTVAYKGKQDDIFFVQPELGWYVNGAGKIYKTTDGGQGWKHIPMGRAVNKIRLLPTGKGFVGYAIGTDVFKIKQDNARLP